MTDQMDMWIEAFYRCPSCGAEEPDDAWDVMGADAYKVFCNHCHSEVDVDARLFVGERMLTP